MPNYGSGWDAKNDPSNKEILGGKAADGTVHGIVTPYVPVYVNGKLYYGYEPDGTYEDGLGGAAPVERPTETKPATTPEVKTTTTTTVTTEAVVTTTGSEKGTDEANDTEGVLYGDATLDGKVTLADALAILQFVANEDKYPLNAQAQKNADCFNPGDGITANDSVAVQQLDTKLIDKLPLIVK